MNIKKYCVTLLLIFGIFFPFVTKAGWIDDVFKAISLSAMIPDDACIRSVDGDIEGSSQNVQDERGLVPNLTELIIGGKHERCGKESICRESGSGRIDGKLDKDKNYNLLVIWGDCTPINEIIKDGDEGVVSNLRHSLDRVRNIFPSKLSSERGIVNAIGSIIRWALGIAGVIFLAMIIYGGFLYLTVGASDKNIDKAKHTITYAIIGIVIIAGSWLIADFVISMLTRG